MAVRKRASSRMQKRREKFPVNLRTSLNIWLTVDLFFLLDLEVEEEGRRVDPLLTRSVGSYTAVLPFAQTIL